METQKTMVVKLPKFATENEEADWWASSEGRKFLRDQLERRPQKSPGGSKLVAFSAGRQN